MDISVLKILHENDRKEMLHVCQRNMNGKNALIKLYTHACIHVNYLLSTLSLCAAVLADNMEEDQQTKEEPAAVVGKRHKEIMNPCTSSIHVCM